MCCTDIYLETTTYAECRRFILSDDDIKTDKDVMSSFQPHQKVFHKARAHKKCSSKKTPSLNGLSVLQDQ